MTGFLEGSLAVFTLVRSVDGAGLPQVLVEHGVSGQLLNQTWEKTNSTGIISLVLYLRGDMAQWLR